MRDHIVRAAFHETVLQAAHLDRNTFVVDELGLKNGVIRADIAVLNGKLVGYEIKTDKDNLNRLSSQINAYSEVFDQAYIISGKKHLSKVLDQVPGWWGVYAIEPDEEKICTFTCLRPAILNEQRSAYSIAQLLWKAEVAEVLETHFNCVARQSWTKHKLYDILIDKIDVHALGQLTLGILKNRQGWRTNPTPLL
jgi:hypothetical protein